MRHSPEGITELSFVYQEVTLSCVQSMIAVYLYKYNLRCIAITDNCRTVQVQCEQDQNTLAVSLCECMLPISCFKAHNYNTPYLSCGILSPHFFTYVV